MAEYIYFKAKKGNDIYRVLKIPHYSDSYHRSENVDVQNGAKFLDEFKPLCKFSAINDTIKTLYADAPIVHRLITRGHYVFISNKNRENYAIATTVDACKGKYFKKYGGQLSSIISHTSINHNYIDADYIGGLIDDYCTSIKPVKLVTEFLYFRFDIDSKRVLYNTSTKKAFVRDVESSSKEDFWLEGKQELGWDEDVDDMQNLIAKPEIRAVVVTMDSLHLPNYAVYQLDNRSRYGYGIDVIAAVEDFLMRNDQTASNMCFMEVDLGSDLVTHNHISAVCDKIKEDTRKPDEIIVEIKHMRPGDKNWAPHRGGWWKISMLDPENSNQDWYAYHSNIEKIKAEFEGYYARPEYKFVYKMPEEQSIYMVHHYDDRFMAVTANGGFQIKAIGETEEEAKQNLIEKCGWVNVDLTILTSPTLHLIYADAIPVGRWQKHLHIAGDADTKAYRDNLDDCQRRFRQEYPSYDHYIFDINEKTEVLVIIQNNEDGSFTAIPSNNSFKDKRHVAGNVRSLKKEWITKYETSFTTSISVKWKQQLVIIEDESETLIPVKPNESAMVYNKKNDNRGGREGGNTYFFIVNCRQDQKDVYRSMYGSDKLLFGPAFDDNGTPLSSTFRSVLVTYDVIRETDPEARFFDEYGDEVFIRRIKPTNEAKEDEEESLGDYLGDLTAFLSQ